MRKMKFVVCNLSSVICTTFYALFKWLSSMMIVVLCNKTFPLIEQRSFASRVVDMQDVMVRIGRHGG